MQKSIVLVASIAGVEAAPEKDATKEADKPEC
jgi:hypothetical protein